mgnify:CR=1 FL=1
MALSAGRAIFFTDDPDLHFKPKSDVLNPISNFFIPNPYIIFNSKSGNKNEIKYF